MRSALERRAQGGFQIGEPVGETGRLGCRGQDLLAGKQLRGESAEHDLQRERRGGHEAGPAQDTAEDAREFLLAQRMRRGAVVDTRLAALDQMQDEILEVVAMDP